MGATPIPRSIINMKLLYKKFAKYYDLVYKNKDYKKEATFIERLIKKNHVKGKELLDVGCGTGRYTEVFKKKGFAVTGLDISNEMLSIARKKIKGAKFVQGNMQTFKLRKKFDVIICLFSTMHYNQNHKQLEKTIKNFYYNLKHGGLIVFDMGFNKERFKPNYTDVVTQKLNDGSLIRIGNSQFAGKNAAKINFVYVLIKGKDIRTFNEVHNLGIFETPKVKRMMEEIGFFTKVYSSYKNKPWKKKSKEYVLFAGIKH